MKTYIKFTFTFSPKGATYFLEPGDYRSTKISVEILSTVIDALDDHYDYSLAEIHYVV